MYINSITINETYNACQLGRRHSGKECISVNGFTHSAHLFSKQHLIQRQSFIICALKRLPKTLRRSMTDKGAPWITARRHGTGNEEFAMDTTEKLLAMGIALDIVSVLPSPITDTDVPYIIIEDLRCRRDQLAREGIRPSVKNATWD